MKIVQVISDSNVGGAGILVSSVSELLKNDFEFEIIIPTDSLLRERLPENGVKITELNFKKDESFFYRDIKLFKEYFQNNPAAIVHTHAALSARIGAFFGKIPYLISTRHCSKNTETLEKMSYGKRKTYNFFTNMTVSTADFATNNLISSGVYPSRIVTIKNGVNPTLKIDTDTRLRLLRLLNFPKSAKILGCCARLESVKGQDLILRAAPKILHLFPNVRFLFVGEGSMKSHYRTMASRMGIEKAIAFTGYTNTPHLYENLFYININASRGTETSCLTTSECMSLGIPTIASNFGGNPEMIFHNKNGLLFEKDNLFSLESEIVKLLSCEKLYKELSDGALSIYERYFSAKRMAKDYKALYLSAIERIEKKIL